jgi:alginate O-acetyltransferase complex protein AlgI
MLFNSLDFAIFLPIVFLLYWFTVNNNLKAQNSLLLIASYFFYSWWDWRFLILLVSLSLTNFLIGIWIEKNESNRKGKIWLITGLIINIGVLDLSSDMICQDRLQRLYSQWELVFMYFYP